MATKQPPVKLIGEEKLRRNFSLLNALVQTKVKDIVNKHAQNIVNEAKRKTPVDMGGLRASIRASFYQNKMTAEVGTNSNYGAFVEFGTGPLGRQTNTNPLPSSYQHGPGGFFPPLQVIRDWCRRHKIPESAAFVIARKIGRNGMKARPFLYPAFLSVHTEFWKDLKQAVPEAAEKLE